MLAITVDIAIISNNNILLIKRKNDPFKDCWAIPGGFIEENEAVETAAKRELLEETSIDVVKHSISLQQFKVYSQPLRDPRQRVISVCFVTIIEPVIISSLNIKAADDAKEFQWFSLEKLPVLAFDHSKIISDIKAHINHSLCSSSMSTECAVKECSNYAEKQACVSTVYGIQLINLCKECWSKLYELQHISMGCSVKEFKEVCPKCYGTNFDIDAKELSIDNILKIYVCKTCGFKMSNTEHIG
jgi:8-oxo-dGTP diphosphatase